MSELNIEIRGKKRVLKNADLESLKQHLSGLLRNSGIGAFSLLLKRRLPPGKAPVIIVRNPEKSGVPMVIQYGVDNGAGLQRFQGVLKSEAGSSALFQELKSAADKSTAMNVTWVGSKQPARARKKSGPKIPRAPIEVMSKSGILFETVGDLDKVKDTLLLISKHIDLDTEIGFASEISPAIIDVHGLKCTRQQFSIFYKYMFQQDLLNKLAGKPLSYKLTEKSKAIIKGEPFKAPPLVPSTKPVKIKTSPLTGLLKQVAMLESQANAYERLKDEIARDEKALADKKLKLEAFQASPGLAKLEELRKLLGVAPEGENADNPLSLSDAASPGPMATSLTQ